LGDEKIRAGKGKTENRKRKKYLFKKLKKMQKQGLFPEKVIQKNKIKCGKK